MFDPLRVLDAPRLDDILREIAERFQVGLELRDNQGRVLCNALSASDRSRPEPDGPSVAVFPLRFMSSVMAQLVVEAPRESTMAAAAAYCLETTLRLEAEIADLSGELVRVYEELSQMYSLTSKLGSEMDVDTICRQVLEETEKLLGVTNLSIMLLDADSGTLRARHSRGRDASAADGFTVETKSSLLGQVMARGTPETIRDIRPENRVSLPYPARSILCVPLITDDRAIGLLLAADKLSGEEFWSRELKLMGMFALEIAASIRKAQLYQEFNGMFISTVGAFASAIDAKDPYTYGHSRRVAQVSMAICQELGLSRQQTGMVELAALLHDIGKIGTPESILNKPGLLQREELQKMKEHPAKGAEILSGIKEFREIITWIRHHHEWYDGEGYPDGIAAEEIPIQARIITIADAFDAMTSDRPYRKGMPLPQVVALMEASSPSQFDPRILAAFRRAMATGRIGHGNGELDGLPVRQHRPDTYAE